MKNEASSMTEKMSKYIASKIKIADECLDEAIENTFFIDENLDTSKMRTRPYDSISDIYDTPFVLNIRLRQTNQLGIRAMDIRREIGLEPRNHIRVADKWSKYVVNEDFARAFFDPDRNDLHIHVEPAQLKKGDAYENENYLIALNELDTARILNMIHKAIIIDR